MSRRFIISKRIGRGGAKVQFPVHILDPIGRHLSTRLTVENDGSSLVEGLVAFEQRLSEQPAELVVLADDSDTALAAALSALKLGVAVEAVPAARSGSSDNARLIAQLAPAYTPDA